MYRSTTCAILVFSDFEYFTRLSLISFTFSLSDVDAPSATNRKFTPPPSANSASPSTSSVLAAWSVYSKRFTIAVGLFDSVKWIKTPGQREYLKYIRFCCSKVQFYAKKDLLQFQILFAPSCNCKSCWLYSSAKYVLFHWLFTDLLNMVICTDFQSDRQYSVMQFLKFYCLWWFELITFDEPTIFAYKQLCILVNNLLLSSQQLNVILDVWWT
jgi:hypothetical protein